MADEVTDMDVDKIADMVMKALWIWLWRLMMIDKMDIWRLVIRMEIMLEVVMGVVFMEVFMVADRVKWK